MRDRFYDMVCRNNKRRWSFYNTLFELVLSSVHPGNLGPLPPSPKVLTNKGVQIGLTSSKELVDMDYGTAW